MKNQFLEAGQIVNTHGIRGEVKIMPWCDGPDFLKAFRTFYIEGKPYQVESSRVHKNMLLCKLKGIDDVSVAQTYKIRWCPLIGTAPPPYRIECLSPT